MAFTVVHILIASGKSVKNFTQARGGSFAFLFANYPKPHPALLKTPKVPDSNVQHYEMLL